MRYFWKLLEIENCANKNYCFWRNIFWLYFWLDQLLSKFVKLLWIPVVADMAWPSKGMQSRGVVICLIKKRATWLAEVGVSFKQISLSPFGGPVLCRSMSGAYRGRMRRGLVSAGQKGTRRLRFAENKTILLQFKKKTIIAISRFMTNENYISFYESMRRSRRKLQCKRRK